MHILMTVNAAWNGSNFRRPLVWALLADGHGVTVLAPPDSSVGDLERIGYRFRPLEMIVKGLNPLEDLKLERRLKKIFREERPDAILSFTIKSNIFGAQAARRVCRLSRTSRGLDTAFLSGRFLQTIAERLYRGAFCKLPVRLLRE